MNDISQIFILLTEQLILLGNKKFFHVKCRKQNRLYYSLINPSFICTYLMRNHPVPFIHSAWRRHSNQVGSEKGQPERFFFYSTIIIRIANKSIWLLVFPRKDNRIEYCRKLIKKRNVIANQSWNSIHSNQKHYKKGLN